MNSNLSAQYKVVVTIQSFAKKLTPLRGHKHRVNLPLIYRGLEIFEIAQRGRSRFSCRNGGSPYNNGSNCFSLNLILALLIKVFFIKKHLTLFFSLLMKKHHCHMSLFLCLSSISLRRNLSKKVLPKGVPKKKEKMGGKAIQGGDLNRGGVQTSCTL